MFLPCRTLLTYCRYEGGVEGVFAESEQQTCLSDSAVSDQQQFEEIIVGFRHLDRSSRRSKAALTNPAVEIAVGSGLGHTSSDKKTGAGDGDVKVRFALWDL